MRTFETDVITATLTAEDWERCMSALTFDSQAVEHELDIRVRSIQALTAKLDNTSCAEFDRRVELLNELDDELRKTQATGKALRERIEAHRALARAR